MAPARRLLFSVGLVCAVATMGVTGCSASPRTPDPTPKVGSTDAPDFAGPWADEFTSTFRRATTEFERTALADGAISDPEFAEMENRFTSCLTDQRVTFAGFKPGGGYEFRPGDRMTSDQANAIADDCSAASGLDTVGYLYFALQRNPQHADDARIVAACLVKKRVVPHGYSASDYTRDSPGMSYPFADQRAGEKALDECSADPLDLLDSVNE